LGENLAEKRKGVGYLNQVLTMHREAQNRYDESDALAKLMLAWKVQQRPLLAIFYGKQAVNIYQSIRAGIKDKNLEKDTQETFSQSKADIYRVLADLLIGDGRLPEAQQVLSLLKEEEYFEFITRDSGDNSTPTKSASLTPEEIKLNEQYEKISAQLPELSRNYAALRDKSSLTEEEKRSLKLLEEQLTIANTKFEKDLQRLDVEFGDTRQSVTLKNVREAQSMQEEDLRNMEEGTVALYTLVGIDRYRVILVAPYFRKAYEYPIKGIDLANKVDAFRNALTNPRVDPLPLAQELYQILIGPMAKDLASAEAKTLMWSLDGVLRYIPMAALHDGRQYLVERYRNVAFTYGSLAHLKDPPSTTWRGLGLGVSKQHESFPALPAVPGELRGIIREEGQGDAGGGVLPGTIMLDEAFTTDSMEAALRGRYPMVHIASHFAFTPGGDETQSFLLLGDGQHLTLAQIRNSVGVEFRGVDLLTLSSCNSAIGGRRGDGIEVDGLAEVAQRKGAKAVVASLWSVADASTQLLMQRFYLMREAQFGLSKAEALRQAQLSLLHGDRADAEQPRSHSGHSLADELDRLARERGITLGGTAIGTRVASSTRYTHPYFWAAFTMVGNWK
jgi:CHAT domain-containing protein